MRQTSVIKESNILPHGFVYLNDIDPTIEQFIAYATSDNFLGTRVKGYEKGVAILTKEAALALKDVQAELKKLNLGLKVFDAYRPQMAVDHFWDWASDPHDIKMKAEYYPEFDDKRDLFNGYLAKLSSHSRGSAVDLTIIDLKTRREFDMGSRFDFLGTLSNTDHPNISQTAKENRHLLRSIMEKHSFKNYDKEWWHFNLIDEPFIRTPEDHFNFVVR